MKNSFIILKEKEEMFLIKNSELDKKKKNLEKELIK